MKLSKRATKTARQVSERFHQEFWERLPYVPLTKTLSRWQHKVDRPIFFLGTQSGGLTLLARVLRRHHMSVYCGGNSYFWAGRDEMQNLRDSELPPVLRLSGARQLEQGFGSDLGQLAGFLYAADKVVEQFRITEKQVNDSDAVELRRTVEWLSNAYNFRSSVPRFVDKSQSFTLKVPLLRRAFPDAKFVVVSRNPYALVHSRSSGKHLIWAQNQASRELAEEELTIKSTTLEKFLRHCAFRTRRKQISHGAT